MDITVAKSAGFCFGVKRAIDKAYELAGKENVYTFGPLIHNEEVVNDLKSRGIKVIESEEELYNLSAKDTVIIRSHGVEKRIYNILDSTGANIADATCPFVLKIHKIVERESKAGKNIIIVGNEGHPEVLGIKGWCDSEVTVVDTVQKAQEISFSEGTEVCVVSQTTFNYKKFEDIVEIISKKGYNSNICNTICNATEERQTEARDIARNVDAMIVIGGKSSSNTQKLYEICKNECENTTYIQTIENLDMSSLRGAKHIGITAGASTPNNIIQEVHTNVRVKF